MNYLEIDKKVQEYQNSGNFSHEQLKEIRKGIQEDIDVRGYAKDSIPAEEMFNKRWELIIKRNSNS